METNPFLKEVEIFKKNWPNIEFIDLIFTDINATPRGKRIPISSLDKLYKGVALPLSTITLDLKGNVIESAGLGQDLGEPDRMCYPVLGTLTPTAKSTVGQVLISMEDCDNERDTLFIRNIVQNMLKKLNENNYFPCIAFELEFYLIDKQRGKKGEIQTAINPIKKSREKNTEVYDIHGLNDYELLLSDINKISQRQNLNTSGALSESAPGQFEINFNHTTDILRACDEIIIAKRLIRQLAHQHDFDATFMAKPFEKYAGNGMHIHLSLLDKDKNNHFSLQNGEPSSLFYQVMAAMLDQIPQSTALICPNINSFRRFVPDSFVPMKSNWGENHRGVALRVPISDSKNRRIEHRIAGADVNPYILAAVILSSVLASKNFTPDACPPPLDDEAKNIPTSMPDALKNLQTSEMRNYISEKFIDLFIACKTHELSEFNKKITPLEIEWLLHSS